MSNYTKTTDFAAKDALLTGNPSKLVKGTEINVEFSNIQTAVNSKLDSSGVTAFAATLLDDIDAATARGTLVAAKSGANTDITSMTGLSNGGIPLAKVSGAAASGPNTDITSLSGLVGAGLVPVGGIVDFAASAAPAGYLACPISATNISRTTYAALFAVLGTTWGSGDGSTTFGMPWFPANYAGVQANANVGTSTAGAVIAHIHQAVFSSGPGGGVLYPISTPSDAGTGQGPTTSTGGSANLAAGVRVLKCVKY